MECTEKKIGLPIGKKRGKTPSLEEADNLKHFNRKKKRQAERKNISLKRRKERY